MRSSKAKATRLDPAMSAARAARLALDSRLKTVQANLARLCEHGTAKPREVHELRVASRRAGAALSLFRSCVKPKAWKKTRAALRRLRQAAADTRQCDVHLRMLREFAASAEPERQSFFEQALADVQEQRRDAKRNVLTEARRFAKDRFRNIHRKCLSRIVRADRTTLGDVAQRVLETHSRRFADLSISDLSDLRTLHDLRLSGKKLRYALELAPSFVPTEDAALIARLEQFQDHLGAINDMAELALRLERQVSNTGEPQADRVTTGDTHAAGLSSVIEECWRRERKLHESFLAAWQDSTWADLLGNVRRLAGVSEAPAQLSESSEPQSAIAIPAETQTETADIAAPERVEPSSSAPSRPSRIAAIDVGTNSVRLVIAEVSSEGDLRIIDDEKAVTRLGHGMSTTGVLSESSMQQSLAALEQFKRIADGYGVPACGLRAVATSAVREASNGSEFAAMVQSRAGVPLEIISPQTEARLAFRSVSQAFDLRAARTAVVDIGGGSTEIVLGSGDLIEQIYAIPLGAIALTEQFSVQDDIPAKRYRRMRSLVQRTLKSIVHRPPFVPHLLIGTGGTFTTLGAMSIHRGVSPEESEVLPFSVRGYELQRSELKHILDHLRHQSLEGRCRMPGLSPERADIIVAGLTIIDCVLKHLQVNTIRVHDQGIRNGLLRSMADDLVSESGGTVQSAAREPDRMRSVRQFAAACNFEHTHAEHVATLALKIFDQLAMESSTIADAGDKSGATGWATPENRELLHAAALVHDVGYFINYASHHKHTYHLVMHSDLAWFTHRQRELIANIARYHRGARPKKRHANFAGLSREDRAVVIRLAAILRLAVGLDRSHTHNIHSITLRLHEGLALMQLAAERDASVDLWGAIRKSRMFEEAFGVRLRLVCTQEKESGETKPRLHDAVDHESPSQPSSPDATQPVSSDLASHSR